MADQPTQCVSLDRLAEVLKDASNSKMEFSEYLKTLRRVAKEAQDALEESERAHLDNLRLIRDNAQARLVAAEAVADACSATRSRKTRKDRGTKKGPKPATQQSLQLSPVGDPIPAVDNEPKAELLCEPF